MRKGLVTAQHTSHLCLAAGFSTWRHMTGCCGFTGPFPSTTLDKQV